MSGEHGGGAPAELTSTRTPTQEKTVLAVRLQDGDVRHIPLSSRTGSIGSALDRLADWVETREGTWIHKRWIVEATVVPGDNP